ncbi:MAG TPA: T9SS type A sorting domain-containing protein [Saprospiraceae bacterium]|nr:T9SS type A sorting domain-containing protein [Saprospiraceae bacterium]
MRIFSWSIVCILFLIPKKNNAQQLSPTVISSSGGFYSNTSGMLSFTTGEMAAVETYISPLNILTQGFQQPVDFSTSTIDHADLNFSFELYPNPTHGEINILTKSESNLEIQIEVVDVLGKIIQQKTFLHESKSSVNHIDLTNAAVGIYFLMLKAKENNRVEEQYFISKIQIVK